MPDRSRPIAVVTGATGGIGRWIARGLAEAERHVVMIGRDGARTQDAAEWIKSVVPGASIETRTADLSSLRETAALGKELLAAHPKISILITNAGIFTQGRRVTVEGHEEVLAVNHLSPFLLTNTLLPALIAHGSSRIVTTGSDTSDRATIDPDNMELARGWNFVRAYRQSKLANMMTTFELAQRLEGTSVTANVVHPGAVATGLVRGGGVIGLAWKMMAPFLLTEEKGAETPLFAGVSETVEGLTGVYFKKNREASPNKLARNPALRKIVWKATERLLGEV